MWPNTKLLELLGLTLPIVQAPMAGANDSTLAIAVSEAGGLGSIPCAMLQAENVRNEVARFREGSNHPVNLNFFCHKPADANDISAGLEAWQTALRPFYEANNIDSSIQISGPNRAPFDASMCELVESLQPEVVSFHFGLPAESLLDRVKTTGAVVLSSATTAAEARWLEHHGCDAIIAQGAEAGGHRGIFLNSDIATQAGTFALVPQVVDAVSVPVIAAGGITDARGIVAAFALGASGVQIGTAYLATPQATISDLHREALAVAADDSTALTNLFSGRPARGIMNKIMREIGPMSDRAPPFPTAGGALAPLKEAAEAQGHPDYSSLWSGQSAALARRMDAGQLTRILAEEALTLVAALNNK
ncbi:MAG: nitronate monooxygenase [Pseudomonadota bacterium]